MSIPIIAVILTTLAVSGAVALTRPADRSMAIVIGGVWVLAVAIAFFAPSRMLAFLALAGLLAAAAVMSQRGAVKLYLGVIAALPISMTFVVPFPGLNYLIILDYAKLATLTLLAPAFATAIFMRAPAGLRSVDHLLLAFVLLTGLLSFRDLPFTSVLRTIADQLILIYVPYLTISRMLTTEKDVEEALQSVFISILILSFIAAITALRSWNYYVHLSDIGSGKAFFDFRNGFLRVGATMGPSLLAFMAGVGVAFMLRARSLKETPLMLAMASLGVIAFAGFVTGARGGWIAAFVSVVLFYVFAYSSQTLRRLTLLGFALALICGLYLINTESPALQDRFGSVSYRAELIRTSFQQIADRPLFGSVDFMSSPRFRHLVQGEGIVDVVNGYLQIALYNGLVGLCLYLFAQGIAFQRGLRALSGMARFDRAAPENASARLTLALLLAMQAGYLALIATISLTTFTAHYAYIILALVVANLRAQSTQAVAAAPSPTVNEALEAPPPSPAPYGGRFVRRR
ncbi:MAG: O-antigen ligase family protein [Pseudomonadota bacterium]